MNSESENQVLRPLGSLAPPLDRPWNGEEIERSPAMTDELRTQVADYLSRSPLFLPWMTYTRDVIGDRFGVAGGTAIYSDGTFYWRADAVEYIKEYGVPIPDDAIRHFQALDWQPPEFSREEWLVIYQQVKEMFVVGEGDEDAIVFHPQ